MDENILMIPILASVRMCVRVCVDVSACVCVKMGADVSVGGAHMHNASGL